ncbi:proapoptotic nucleolar protein 1 [Oxyura jamaicensis]|uniref:proapoptotic nucleolar protein 1 n=1 Tax=Oxyura jamaicensis TaxID=8884 RepID=UPI0015A6B8D3|nr:proapoptotic nucleolar protein 1 [Oxyura jamaicensis]
MRGGQRTGGAPSPLLAPPRPLPLPAHLGAVSGRPSARGPCWGARPSWPGTGRLSRSAGGGGGREGGGAVDTSPGTSRAPNRQAGGQRSRRPCEPHRSPRRFLCPQTRVQRNLAPRTRRDPTTRPPLPTGAPPAAPLPTSSPAALRTRGAPRGPRHGSAWPGTARHGSARQGTARHALTTRGLPGGGRLGPGGSPGAFLEKNSDGDFTLFMMQADGTTFKSTRGKKKKKGGEDAGGAEVLQLSFILRSQLALRNDCPFVNLTMKTKIISCVPASQ